MVYWMDVEEATSCVYDSLSVYDGGWFTEGKGELLAKLCGTSVGDAYVTTKRRATLVFKSDHSIHYSGFELDYGWAQKGNMSVSQYQVLYHASLLTSRSINCESFNLVSHVLPLLVLCHNNISKLSVSIRLR